MIIKVRKIAIGLSKMDQMMVLPMKIIQKMLMNPLLWPKKNLEIKTRRTRIKRLHQGLAPIMVLEAIITAQETRWIEPIQKT